MEVIKNMAKAVAKEQKHHIKIDPSTHDRLVLMTEIYPQWTQQIAAEIAIGALWDIFLKNPEQIWDIVMGKTLDADVPVNIACFDIAAIKAGRELSPEQS